MMGNVKERCEMMALITSSRIAVVGAWSEFALEGMASLTMTHLRLTVSLMLLTWPLVVWCTWTCRSAVWMACCSLSAVVVMPADELMRKGDWGGGGLRGTKLDWERMWLSLGLSSSMVLVTEEPGVSVVTSGVIGAWMWL